LIYLSGLLIIYLFKWFLLMLYLLNSNKDKLIDY